MPVLAEHRYLIVNVHIQVLCNYAGLLGESASVEVAQHAAEGEDGANNNADSLKRYSNSAALLRRAAGVYDYVRDVMLPNFEGKLATDRSPTPSLSWIPSLKGTGQISTSSLWVSCGLI